MNSVRIILVAKAPLPGLAKTRLAPALGKDGAAKLALKLLQHSVNEAVAADTGPVELYVSPSVADPVWDGLNVPGCVQWSQQPDGDLGERLAAVAQRVTGQQEAVLLMGTDCPGLTASVLRDAALALTDDDACLVPVSDGGYALLGLKQYLPSVFTDMPWSTSQVAELTIQRILAAGRSLKILPELHDIDEPADLQWLPSDWD
ncbi:2-phospho-L-lactate guanylyltransferase [Vibrio aerogenes CECT 7868]|uniref:2-phospho-L-lactate guanylyltransferase n=1 Tax=Vibrio aerogenes CECT 7868 TaxID=1216006 RepID=A0A1M5XCU9_9VIBR|nr:TIGR04282 family arsenosugar biosynthesis glycosyltransferase [Vibrio aerogenes]SHH97559.1 2-phospho-L-lactate guanylyltransferase [Vibrio aerogenes CECT 7868]